MFYYLTYSGQKFPILCFGTILIWKQFLGMTTNSLINVIFTCDILAVFVSVLPHAISYVYTWDMSRSSTQFRWFGCWNVKVLQKQLSQIVYWKHDDLQIFSLYVCLAIYIICPITLPLIHNLEWFKCKSLVYSSILWRPSTHTIMLNIPYMNSVHYHKVIYLTKTTLSSNGAVYVDSNIERWWTQKYTMKKLTYYPIEVEWPKYAYLNWTIIGSGNGL